MNKLASPMKITCFTKINVEQRQNKAGIFHLRLFRLRCSVFPTLNVQWGVGHDLFGMTPGIIIGKRLEASKLALYLYGALRT